jgi:hypothetical protein
LALITLVSAGGAPGVTTTALALTLAWPERVLLVEADSDGGSVMAGYFGAHLPYDRGLLPLALQLEERPADTDAVLAEQTWALDEAGQRPVLPGPRDPFQAEALTPPVWRRLVSVLAAQDRDVLVDAGQLRRSALPLVAAADLIVVVLRPTARQVVAAQPRLAWLRQELGDRSRVGLCLIGHGPHDVGEIRSVLGDFATVILLPWDVPAAARLSDGIPQRRSSSRGSPLLGQARSAAHALWAAAQPSSFLIRGGER